MPLLSLERISSYYGEARALADVSLEVEDGEIVAVIGSNGAGKTTMLRTISGLMHPRSGRIYFQGEAIERTRPHQLIRRGIAHIPEGRRLFAQMTVRENLLMGAYGAQSWKERGPLIDEVCALFPRLRERIGQLAGTLSGGERQMLATARALMARPRHQRARRRSDWRPRSSKRSSPSSGTSTGAGLPSSWSSRTPSSPSRRRRAPTCWRAEPSSNPAWRRNFWSTNPCAAPISGFDGC